MAVWPKASPLTAGYLSPLPGSKSQPGYVRKLPVTCDWAVVLAGYSGSFHYLQVASQELATIWHKCIENQILKPNSTDCSAQMSGLMANRLMRGLQKEWGFASLFIVTRQKPGTRKMFHSFLFRSRIIP